MRVLIAEDEPIARLRLQRRLEGWGYDVSVARDGAEAWAKLQEPDAPRMAVLDWMMPGLDGPEICRLVRAQAREPYIYIILLTGKNERQDVVAGLEAGADDYVPKPFDASELEVRLRAGLRITTLQAELIAARESLRFSATHDGLTGIANRAALDAALAREICDATRVSRPLAAVMIDVDRFKRINDTYGHPVGDIVLSVVASRMRGGLRPGDTLGRYGGEEFLALLPGCDERAALGVAERLRRALREVAIELPTGPLTVTASFGVAVSDGSSSESALVAAADAALYRAKQNGRDRIEPASTLDHARTPTRPTDVPGGVLERCG